jgi:hypothetical protein
MGRREQMSHRERFESLMDFQPVDRLPRIEWAVWWDQTIDRWCSEGLPSPPTAVALDVRGPGSRGPVTPDTTGSHGET